MLRTVALIAIDYKFFNNLITAHLIPTGRINTHRKVYSIRTKHTIHTYVYVHTCVLNIHRACEGHTYGQISTYICVAFDTHLYTKEHQLHWNKSCIQASLSFFK